MRTLGFMLTCSLISLGMIGTLTTGVPAEDTSAKETAATEDSSPKDAQAKARQELILKAMQKYEVVLDGDRDKKATLDPKILLRWSNPTSDVVDGLMSIYSAGKGERPAMIAHIYVHGAELNGLAMQEFADVHPGKVELFRGKGKVWSPRSRNSQFEELPGAPQPADKPAARLRQLKDMAARFEIVDGFHDKDSQPQPQRLRMLARPTYRYGNSDGEIIDGALFTFVVATDPEACLLIEIHRKGDATHWEYMLLPMTIYSLDARLDGKLVWTKPEAMVFGDPTAPHYISSYRSDPGEPEIKSLLPMP